ncbi:MAG: hypothetical protein KDA61_17915 [Planctomycetales bacterium]|nr:hypothetical protein [Planctomycetales bacterium]
MNAINRRSAVAATEAALQDHELWLAYLRNAEIDLGSLGDVAHAVRFALADAAPFIRRLEAYDDGMALHLAFNDAFAELQFVERVVEHQWQGRAAEAARKLAAAIENLRVQLDYVSALGHEPCACDICDPLTH